MNEPDRYVPTPYDTVKYPSYSHSFSHVDRLATQARLFGVGSAPPSACRVLELGCGNGSNLIPMAYGLPGSRFVGVDNALGPIRAAMRMAVELGIDNVEFIHRDILELDRSLGMFDYIVVHGLYSWVPPAVADKILALCGELLAADGVAFVSYLAYPGSHARQMLREIMMFHLQAVDDPATVQAEAGELAAWLVSVPSAGDSTRAAMQADAARFLAADVDYVFHDDLAEWNVPVYFTQFVNAAAFVGLQFLAEADAVEMEAYDLPDEMRARLDVLSGTRVLREQYLDFARARRFRQTLLCRTGVTVTDAPEPARLASLYLSSPTPMPEGGIDLAPQVDVRFESPRGSTLETHYPLGKAALEVLIAEAPRRLSFDALEATARVRVGSDVVYSSSAELQEFLLRLHTTGYVSLHTEGARIVSRAGPHPLVNAVARWQAREGRYVTSSTHVGYTYGDDLGLRLIPLADGTRDRAALMVELGVDDAIEIDRQLDGLARLGFVEA